jgi:sec-independent protein translocase protein TatB
MFGIAWSELLLIGVVALVVIPPKDLPKAMRLVGKWVGQMRRMAFDFQSQVSSALREAEFDDLKKTFTEATSIEAMADIRAEIESATKPLTEMEGQFRQDLSIEPEIKSFPVAGPMGGQVTGLADGVDMGLDARPTLESETSTPPGPVDWPGAMDAKPVSETAAPGPIADSAPHEPVAEEMSAPSAEVTRLPSRADAELVPAEHDRPSHEAAPARVSGASS